MELRTLQYFLTVAREENITRASEVLHITQPTLSRQIKQLEQELGTELFVRGRNFALPAGQLRSDNYEVGDIAYWPPRHSFVILYKQNGECFERQHLGWIINGDLSVFKSGGEMQVSFSKAE